MKMRLGAAYLSAAMCAALHAPVGAVAIDYTSSGSGAVSFFAGTQQESTFTFTGCPDSFLCQASLDLTAGVPQIVISHGFGASVGTNDGDLFGPDATVNVTTLFTVDGQSIPITQSFRFRQIANDQFMLELSASPTVTFDLGALGELDITAQDFAGQVPSGFGGGSGLRSTFLLRPAPVQTPEPAVLGLLGLGILSLAALRGRKV